MEQYMNTNIIEGPLPKTKQDRTYAKDTEEYKCTSL